VFAGRDNGPNLHVAASRIPKYFIDEALASAGESNAHRQLGQTARKWLPSEPMNVRMGADYRHSYSAKGLAWLAGGLSIGALMANTDFDELLSAGRILGKRCACPEP